MIAMQTQLLFDVEQSLPERSKFHGATYDEALDYERLNNQERAIYNALIGGEWLTLEQLRDRTMYASERGYALTGISARIRSIRAHGFRIDGRRVGRSGLWVYRLCLNDEVGE